MQISHTASSKTLRNVQRCDASLSINDLFCDACFARNPTVEKLLWKVDSPEMSKKDNCKSTFRFVSDCSKAAGVRQTYGADDVR